MSKDEFTSFIRKILIHNKNINCIKLYDENCEYLCVLNIEKLDYSLSKLLNIMVIYNLSCDNDFEISICDNNLTLNLYLKERNDF